MVTALLMAGAVFGISRFATTYEQNAALETPAPEPADALGALNDAYRTGSCDQFMAATTQVYRDQIAVTTCDAFTAYKVAQDAVGGFPILDVTSQAAASDQSMVLHVQENGTVSGPSEADYSVVRVDGVWVVNGRTSLGGA